MTRAFALQGEVFRDVAGRRTMRVHVGEQAYFVKLHEGIGWGEVIKNWLQLKAPIVGASNEYLACEGLAAEDIDAPRVAAFAEQDTVLPRRRSFVLLDELAGYEDLETLGHRWLEAMPDGLTKHRYLRAVAQFARRFHEAGFVHRDFYICHLLVHQSQRQAPQRLAVLDLHRARRFAAAPALAAARSGGVVVLPLGLGLQPARLVALCALVHRPAAGASGLAFLECGAGPRRTSV